MAEGYVSPLETTIKRDNNKTITITIKTMAEETTESLDRLLKNFLVRGTTWLIGLKEIRDWIDAMVTFLPQLQPIQQVRDDPDKLKSVIALSIETDWSLFLLKITEYLMPYHHFWETLVMRTGAIGNMNDEYITFQSILNHHNICLMNDYQRVFPITIQIALEPLMTTKLTYSDWYKLFRYIRLFAVAGRDIKDASEYRARRQQ